MTLIAHALGMRGALLNRARQHLGKHHWDAEDVVQSMFLDLIQQAAEQRPVAHPGSYLLTIVSRMAAETNRTRPPHAVPFEASEEILPCIEFDDSAIDCERRLAIAENALTRRQRQICAMTALGFSYPEVGRRLGISALTVDVMLKHSRKRLRQVAA